MELAIVKKMIEAQIPPGKLGLDEKLLSDAEGRKVYQFVVEFYRKYEKLPSLATVEQETNVQLGIIDTSEPIAYYIGQLKKREKTNRIVRFAKWTYDELSRSDDPDKVIDLMRSLVRDVDSDKPQHVWNIAEDMDRRAILEEYERVKKLGGRPTGIEFPWPSINVATNGIQPGDFVSVIARSETGKTWTLAIMATHAHKKGARVLFVSPEMAQEIVRYRLTAVYQGIPYGPMRKGTMSAAEESRLKEFVEKPITPSFIIADSAIVQSSEHLDFLVTEYRPDIVFVDSYYLLSVEGRFASTNERREALTIELYAQAKRRKVPYVVSTHFKAKAGGKEKKGEAEDVAYTQQVIRLADLAFGLYRSEEDEANRAMQIQMLKHREGAKGELLVSFDLELMDFRELEVKGIDKVEPVVSAGTPPSGVPPSGTPPTGTPPPPNAVSDDSDTDVEDMPF